MTDDAPKRGRGRPRVHATPEQARAAAVARATAHTRARRQALVERTIAWQSVTLDKAEALVEARGLDGLTALVEALVDEETERLLTASREAVVGDTPAP